MDLTTEFPEPFRFLDEEHAEIGAMLAVLRRASSPGGAENPAFVSRRLFRKIAEHATHEEEVMKDCGYPERELHEKYHQHINYSIELVLQLFDRERMAEHGVAIARHIENKMSEEIFVDRLFAAFLAGRDIRE